MLFIENNDTNMILELFDVNEMLLKFKEVSLINSISDNYGKNIYNLCNNITMYFGTFLTHTFGSMVKNLAVCEGVFNMQGNHTWLQLDDYIIDASLAQFVSNAPQVSFLDIATKEYVSCNEYSFNDWVKKIEKDY